MIEVQLNAQDERRLQEEALKNQIPVQELLTLCIDAYFALTLDEFSSLEDFKSVYAASLQSLREEYIPR